MTSCTLPGRGSKAEYSYRTLCPILKALEAYNNDNGTYPKNLKILTPKYVDSVPDNLNRFPINYSTVNDQKDFALRFKYSGPGLNWCDYKTATQKWKCGGAY